MAGRPDTRRRILEAAYGLFYRNGFARVGIDRVAERAGITKRSLYYHFASKDDLLAAVLEHHEQHALDRIAGWSLRAGGSADAFLESLFGTLADWAARPRWEGAGFTRLVMELADRPGHPARLIARRHKAAVEAWLAAELGRPRRRRRGRTGARDRAVARGHHRAAARARQQNLCPDRRRGGQGARAHAPCRPPRFAARLPGAAVTLPTTRPEEAHP